MSGDGADRLVVSGGDAAEPARRPMPPSRTEALEAAWREYYARAAEPPAHPAARGAMRRDLEGALARLIPSDAAVFEAGCADGSLLAALPNAVRHGVDYLPEVIAAARAQHPDITFEVADITAREGAGRAGSVVPVSNERLYDAVICDRLCHSVLDVQALLLGLKRRLSPDGRIYMTAFNYLWEVPSRLAEKSGWKRPAPGANWLSDADFRNLFDIAGLEVVRFEDRMMLPLDVPVASEGLNKYLVRVPGLQALSLYRVYVLRDRGTPAPTRRASVTVVVPARNEAGNIQAAIDRTPVMGKSTELIFVEGNSKDNTWETIQSAMSRYNGPLTLRAFRQSGKGKGDAVRLGFAHATGDLLMILDADLTVPPEDLPAFYDVMARGQADYVHGTRLVYPMEPGAMRFFNKIGNVAFSQLFTYLLNQPIKDTLCGTKVLWRKDYERIAAGRSYFGDFDPFGDFDLIFGAARLGLKIAELPVRYRDRSYGETNISRWKHGWLLLRMSAIAARKIKFV